MPKVNLKLIDANCFAAESAGCHLASAVARKHVREMLLKLHLEGIIL